MKRFLLLRKRWKIAGISILIVVIVMTTWFPRNYHFAFDSHHKYEEATFFQWVAGWFGDWNLGPLTVDLIEGPYVHQRRNHTRSSFLWHKKRQHPEADLMAWIEDDHGFRFAIAKTPTARDFLVYCGNPEIQDFRCRIGARHVGNQADQIGIPPDQSQRNDPPKLQEYSMIAWLPTKIDFKKNSTWPPQIGQEISLPGEAPIENWAFRFEFSGQSELGDPITGLFFVAFDQEPRKWRIFERTYPEPEGVDSWIKADKTVETAFPNGFDPS